MWTGPDVGISGSMPATTDPAEAAAGAGLRYVVDDEPGIARRRCGRGFTYVQDGKTVASAVVRNRIEELVIPPAWTEVWICVDEDGHVQATGRDAAGRKQYRYHDRWQEIRDLDKFEQLAAFGDDLDGLRRRVDADLRRRGLTRERVLALVVRLLDETLIRVGNEQYAADDSFGLTTLRSRHVDIGTGVVNFEFEGKSGVAQEVHLADRQLAALIRRCDEQGGDQLFVYEDEQGGTVEIRSDDVNEYLRSLAGPQVSARDFRTWGGTVAVTRNLGPRSNAPAEERTERELLAAFDEAAELLGNTRDVCRRAYVHPAIPAAYLDGALGPVWRGARRSKRLTREERATLRLLQRLDP